MTNGINMKITLAGAVVALVVAIGSVAQADQAPASSADGVYVCNTASHNGGHGGLQVASTDGQGAVHFSEDLSAKGNGNLNAAEHSKALALCVAPDSFTGGGGTY